jgi:hypothetical protein
MKFLFLLFPLFLFSQESVNPKVNAYIDSLGIDTNYFFLEETHPGMIFMFRTNKIQYECVKNDYYVSTDLYWKDLNQNYWKKSFQKCSDETPITVDSSYLNFAERNFEIIKNEEVLKYQTKKDSVVGDNIYKSFKILNHEPIMNYVFRINSNLISKKFEPYYLTTEGDNINFEYNQSLKLIELDRKINSNP